MKDNCQSKEQLINELRATRDRVLKLEEYENKRTTFIGLMLEIDEKWAKGELAPRLGSWTWNVTSGEVVMRIEIPDEKGGVELECQFSGIWREIVAPEMFDQVMTRFTVSNPAATGPFFVKTKAQAWLDIDSAVSDSLERNGLYLDCTPWVNLFTRIMTTPEEHCDTAFRDILLFKMERIYGAETIRILTDKHVRLSDSKTALNEEIERMQQEKGGDLAEQAEIEKKFLGHALDLLSHVAHNFNAPVCIKNSELKYTYVSPAMTKLLGVPESELLGKTDSEVFGGQCGWFHEDHFEGLKGKMLCHQTWLDLRTGQESALEQIILMSFADLPIGPETEHWGILIHPRWGLADDSLGGQADSRTKVMQDIMEKARRVAKTDTMILITGETGVGKDHLAKYIHQNSNRSDQRFFPVDCASISKEMAESELFGHEKGAFTGAVGRKRGLLELAEGGTLFLNEIGELSLPLQAKLLIFLDDKKFVRVGGEKKITVNARIIAATNRDLESSVKEGTFRKDLYYRLKKIQLRIPPLRERLADIPELLQELGRQLQKEMLLPDFPHLDLACRKKLEGYHWPGNVRELRNVLEKALILSGGTSLGVDLLELESEQHGDKLEEESHADTNHSRSNNLPADPAWRPERDLSDEEFKEMYKEICVKDYDGELFGVRGAATVIGMFLKCERETVSRRIRRLGLPKVKQGPISEARKNEFMLELQSWADNRRWK